MAKFTRNSRQLKMSKKLGKVKGIYIRLTHVTCPDSYLSIISVKQNFILSLRRQPTNHLMAGSNPIPFKKFSKVLLKFHEN